MFTDVIADLNRSKMPEPVNLKKRFDFALTKKMGVVRLPPAFWMQDSKINPRSDHLLWASLLLLDRGRIELAIAILEEELDEIACTKGCPSANSMEQMVEDAINKLLQQMPDREQRAKFREDLRMVIPEWMRNISGPS